MENVDKTYFIEHIAEAIEKGYIHAFYQPIFRSVTGKMMCAESLARWIDPEKGMFSPALFIPALEEAGLIFDLDMEILRQNCAFYKELCSRGTLVHSFSVNLSRLDFIHADLFERVVSTLDAYKVPHDAIKLEVTESVMIDETERFNSVLKLFNDAGFTMWMDDFGSGYSSLNVLKNYNFDLIKFDMVFLHDFSMKGRKVLASLINMAKLLGIHTLMEGIEFKEQQQFMIDAGCEALQGFYFSKPCTKEEIISLIDKNDLVLESVEDREYWSQIGRLNFLSAHPFEEFSGIDSYESDMQSDGEDVGMPLALLECTHDSIRYVYASALYLKNLKKIGFNSTAEVENDFNNNGSEQALMMKRFMEDVVRLETIQRVEYTVKDTYYRLSAKCLAKKKDCAMIAYYLSAFDSEKEVNTANELIYFCDSLFSTYEEVVLIYPDKKIANRIYTSKNLPKYDRQGSPELGLLKFCETEVEAEDQERYLKFLNHNTVFKRVDDSPNRFVQSYFRMHLSGTPKKWYSVRLSQATVPGENAYLLTIQLLTGSVVDFLDIMSKEHPDFLSES